MVQLHHTWQLRITSRRACIPSTVLSFKAMARRTGLFPASWDTNATRFLAQTWTRGWKAKVYRCVLLQLGEPSYVALGEEESCNDSFVEHTENLPILDSDWTWVCWTVPAWLETDTQLGWSAKPSHGTGHFRKHFLNYLKMEEFGPERDSCSTHPKTT